MLGQMPLEEYKIDTRATNYIHCLLEPRHPQNEGRTKEVTVRNRCKTNFKSVAGHLNQNGKTEL